MCGIAGIIGHGNRAVIERMSALLSHRGPDDSGYFEAAESLVFLIHRRLSIIDTSSAGHQPMVDAERKLTIVYNGEIYNYRELRQELTSQGHVFTSHSDTEVLLRLYAIDGERMLKRLNGIYAFSIWDDHRKRLFAARDALGVKPFYYVEGSNWFSFASEIKALLAIPDVSAEINPEALYSHLIYLWSPSPATILKQVKKLPPGHALIVREGVVERLWQHYDPPCSAPLVSMEWKESASELHDVIGAAVRRQLVSDVPVGSFLSGGLDSSLVTSFAAEALRPAPFESFTIDLDMPHAKEEGFADDLPYAEMVAASQGVHLNRVRVGPEMVDLLPKMIYHLDEPQADPAPLNTYLICQAARKAGIKVLLSGAGGDDVFSGYRRHTALELEKYWIWLPSAVRSAIAAVSGRMYKRSPFLRRFSKAFAFAAAAEDARLVSYFFWIDPVTGRDLLSREFRQGLSTSQAFQPLIEALERLPDAAPRLNKMLYLEEKFFLPDHNLNYTDKLSMACGVEVRVPLLDPAVINYAAQLPIHFKHRGLTGKWLLRKAAERRLPRQAIYRPKSGFGAPLRRWLHVELHDFMRDILSESSLRRRGMFNPEAIQALINEDRAGSVDGAYTLFAVMCIELWCRTFLDQRPSLLAGKPVE